MNKDAVLLIGIDLAKEKDCQCAILNLYYNGTSHIIYQTTDKEQVAALNDIMKKTKLFIKPQEQYKVLDIIKEKRINVEKFMYTFVDVDMWTYKQYLSDYKLYGTELLTEEEFDLLKRYFK